MPTVRSDIIDAYIFRKEGVIELLQVYRTEPPISWQTVMGHIEHGESSLDTLWRELREEVGLARDHPTFLGAWALEQVHPFYLPASDSIVLSPRFAVRVAHGWTPVLNHEHSAHRWVAAEQAREHFIWPGQHAAIAELRSLDLDGSRRL